MRTRFLAIAFSGLVSAVLPATLQAQNFSMLYQFCSGGECADGQRPIGSLARDASGNLYGTTWKGGGCSNCGTVFKLAPGGTLTVLHAFTGVNGDGMEPLSGVLRDNGGNLYGTTSEGGSSDCGEESGCGTVFKIAPDGTETILYTFGNSGSGDGIYPTGRLVADLRGNLFGTTYVGGAYGVGTIFRISATGEETIRHSFKGGSDGAYPQAGLLIDANHNQFGTTSGGGDGRDCAEGCGTVFELAPDNTETVLYAFQGLYAGQQDGAEPVADLIEDKTGNLYGTTESGGKNGGPCYFYEGCGTVFRIAPDGTETVLHRFNTRSRSPLAGVTFDRSVNLYGTTADLGSVFRLSPDGKVKVLHAFTASDGDFPAADLLKGPNDELYGTTEDGGAYDGGTIFVIRR